jgi:hypothetical protein
MRAAIAAMLGVGLSACFTKPDPPSGRMPDAMQPFDVCQPQPLEHPLRYSFVPRSAAVVLIEAQDQCRARGMEMLSINDDAERVELATAIQQHVTLTNFIYTGTNDEEDEGVWVGADGCPALEFFALGEPDGGNSENCTAIDPDGLFDGPCTRSDGGFTNNKTVGCELARWPTAACLARVTTHGTLTLDTTPRTLAEATSACTQTNARVIEIESAIELAAARALANGTTFWLGARQAEFQWQRESGLACPQLLPWGPGQPNFSMGPNQCAAHIATGAEVRPCTTTAATICEALE